MRDQSTRRRSREDFRALFHKILHHANRGLPRLDFLKEVGPCAAMAGVLGGAVGVLAVAVLHVGGAPAMPGRGYALFKGLYGGLLPVLLQPSMVWAILHRGGALRLRSG